VLINDSETFSPGAPAGALLFLPVVNRKGDKAVFVSRKYSSGFFSYDVNWVCGEGLNSGVRLPAIKSS
jgi:hypothetical protein